MKIHPPGQFGLQFPKFFLALPAPGDIPAVKHVAYGIAEAGVYHLQAAADSDHQEFTERRFDGLADGPLRFRFAGEPGGSIQLWLGLENAHQLSRAFEFFLAFNGLLNILQSA